jgi:hypothetical protein
MARRGGRRRYVPCPTKKRKFSKDLALLKCQELHERDGDVHKPYQCVCGWWHTLNRSKRRRKEASWRTMVEVWENEGGSLGS